LLWRCRGLRFGLGPIGVFAEVGVSRATGNFAAFAGSKLPPWVIEGRVRRTSVLVGGGDEPVFWPHPAVPVGVRFAQASRPAHGRPPRSCGRRPHPTQAAHSGGHGPRGQESFCQRRPDSNLWAGDQQHVIAGWQQVGESTPPSRTFNQVSRANANPVLA